MRRAAGGAPLDPAMAIIARTNAGQLDDEAAVERVCAYQAAGVDAICLVGVRDFDHLERLAAPLDIPLMLVTYGNPELRDRARLAALGVRVVVNGHAAYFAAIKATYDCLREQRDIAASELNASQLATRYSTLDEYREWARDYMDVKE
jgi:carboxyvinyl-carboxyphosphonate phosphorylmutase